MLVPTLRTVMLLVVGCVVGITAYWSIEQVFLVPAAMMIAIPLVGLATLVPAFRSRDASVEIPLDLREGRSGTITVHAPPAFADAQFRWRSLASGFKVAWVPLQGTEGAFLTGDLRRGQHTLEGVQLRVTDVFGTWRWQPKVGGNQTLTVGPATLPLEAKLRSGFGSSEVARLTGVTDQMDQLIRDHRREDGVRRIHWRQSAKHDRLVVRKEEPPAAGRALVVLDTTSSGYRDDDEFDAAVRTFSSLAELLRRAGTQVEYAETAGPQLSASAPRFSDGQLARALATITLRDEPAQLPAKGRVSVHLVCGESPSPEVASFIAGLGARDSVWGATRELVERGFAVRMPLAHSESDYFSELFA